MDSNLCIININNLHYHYPGQTAGLVGITCAIPRGRKTVILGPNGAGKSTLLLALTGIFRPQEGEIRVEGRPVDYSRAGLTDLRTRVGLIMQQPDVQLFCPVVSQDVAYGPTNLGLPPEEVEQRVDWALEVVGGRAYRERPVHCLSHGEKQRVATAGVLAMRPGVFLLDEPTAGLDKAGVADLLAGLEQLQEQGATLVMTTHDLDLAWGWADHFIVMDKGRLIWEGDFPELAGSPDLPARLGLGRPMVCLVWESLRQQGLLGNMPCPPRRVEDLIDGLGTGNKAPRAAGAGKGGARLWQI